MGRKKARLVGQIIYILRIKKPKIKQTMTETITRIIVKNKAFIFVLSLKIPKKACMI